MALAMSSVRFSQVVAAAGEPTPHAFWVPPAQDAEFQRALKANRVMTVAPRARGKADLGHVGFDAKAANQRQVLVFPKSLKRFENAEIVGVKFDLVQQPETVAAKTELRRTTAKTKRTGHAKPVPAKTGATTARNVRPALAGTGDSDAASPRNRRSPAPRSAPPARSRAKAEPTAHPSSDYDALAKEVRAALDELRDGKAVAAYQRLERAIKQGPS